MLSAQFFEIRVNIYVTCSVGLQVFLTFLGLVKIRNLRKEFFFFMMESTMIPCI